MRTVSMFVLSAIMFLFHILLAPAIEIFIAKIDFIMISIVLLAVFSKKWYPSVICGVYSGLAVDITTQAGTYINTGIYLAFGLLIGFGALIMKNNEFVPTVLITGILTALKHLVFVFLLYVMRLSESFTFGTFIYGLPSVAYTLVACAGIYFVYKGIFSFPFMEEKTGEEGKRFI